MCHLISAATLQGRDQIDDMNEALGLDSHGQDGAGSGTPLDSAPSVITTHTLSPRLCLPGQHFPEGREGIRRGPCPLNARTECKEHLTSGHRGRNVYVALGSTVNSRHALGLLEHNISPTDGEDHCILHVLLFKESFQLGIMVHTL